MKECFTEANPTRTHQKGRESWEVTKEKVGCVSEPGGQEMAREYLELKEPTRMVE